ncbi:Pumilio y domain member 6 [Knufia obscura]|uniref:Pumilio y domain member 6 n=2 Tax=Knufia TaxID=430999 RepID=A0AAN8IAA3_9EURO|nr:Pumilio y domain member 6 [Knufia obscura]KAK5956481.1 Pumilio y domain member 6 [Knufia fluminis]
MAEPKRKAGTDAGPPPKKFKSEHGNNGVHPDRQRFQGGKPNGFKKEDGKEGVLNGQSSREAHHKQKALRLERQAAKPNADSIARSKKIWERLRIKSAVPKDERRTLVDELFSIITGRVKEFVFKHDSVRVIQCALKYASPEQRTQIAEELRGSYRELAESKYAKFLVAKLISEEKGGSHRVRDMIVPEFYGSVKRLVRHPEASWIVDDIYRGLATQEQKARLLREWYGGEFAVAGLHDESQKVTGDLATILRESPGKRGPVMGHLKEMTNQLVQKKTTGFTMLHDAMLQYFLNCAVGTPEHTEFLEMLRDDEEGDLFKNLAFTKSGSRVVCLALAYGGAKDRRNILKHYKTHVKLMAMDAYAHLVLLTALEVVDDTVMTAKAIIPELVGKDLDAESRDHELLGLATHIHGRVPLLFLMAGEGESPKWLLDTPHHDTLREIREIRKTTSKKEPETRRVELNKAIAQPLLDFIASQAEALVQTSYGCQFIGEILIGANGEKEKALEAMASLAAQQNAAEMLTTPHAGRLFKTLVQGGRFNPATKTVEAIDPPLKFAELLYNTVKEEVEDGLLTWATGSNSWTIVAMLENEGFEHKDELVAQLRKHRAELAAPKEDKAAGAGTKVLLEKIGEDVEEGGVPLREGHKSKKDKSKKAKREAADAVEDVLGEEMKEVKKVKKEKKSKKGQQ